MSDVILITIEAAAKAARDARNLLNQRALMMKSELEALQRKRTPGLRNAVAAVADADSKLLALLQQAPHLFKRPKSMVLHGIRLGYKQGGGKLTITDADAAVRLIKKHFPEQFDTLVKTKHTPIKTALANLSAADLKKLGITVQSSGEVVFMSDEADSVDKLVAALLKGAEAEAEEEAEA